MRERIVGSNKQKYIRALVGGRVNSGKTHFAATTPRPYFISDASEGGARTLDDMDRDLWWDAKVIPRVTEIESMLEMPKLITALLETKGTIKEQTLVIDSLSIYAQRVLRELRNADPGGDNRQRYGQLSDALSSLVARVHCLPMHIIWLCHVDDEMQLSVPGKATAALWAYMDYKWMVHVDTGNKAPDFQLHIRPFLRANWLGGRSRIVAPSPMIPSFKPLAELLGLPDRPASLACPDFGGVSYREGATYLPQTL